MIETFFPRRLSRLTALAACLAVPLFPAVMAQEWEALPLVTAEQLATGHGPGGEGCQWPVNLGVDPGGSGLMFLGTDVGGVYRSTDGGVHWAGCNLGLNARGACGFAVDPHNPRRVLLAAANSMVSELHGLYLSTDGGESWRHVLPRRTLGYRDHREQIAFDPGTFDPASRRTRVAYWSSEKAGDPRRLFKTEDGGETWRELPSSIQAGQSIVKVHLTRGFVYAANAEGFWKSTDGGQTFRRTFSGALAGMDVVARRPDAVFALGESGLLVSQDAGEHFAPVPCRQPPPRGEGRQPPARLAVSPADPDRMLLDNDEGQWNWTRYVSRDGGATWGEVALDASASFIPTNNREAMFVWHPTNPDVAWSFGGDFVTRSTDGGRTFAWSNHGNTGIMLGGAFHFTASDPDTLYFGSQDYNGAITTDAGRSWRYVPLSGESWGGLVYGGYASDARTIFGGKKPLDNDRRVLRFSRDGGADAHQIPATLAGNETSFQDPREPRVLFAYDQRSDDAGQTWRKMDGCSGVLTATGDALFGANGNALVRSDDHGATWRELVRVPVDRVNDVAADPGRERLYAAGHDGKLFRWDAKTGALTDLTDRLPADQLGRRGAFSVAADPTDPAVLYTAHAGNTYLKDTAVARSRDAGETWETLTRNTRGLGAVRSGPDGGREANWVRVHRRSRYAYVGTNCFGMWRIGPPPPSDAGTGK